jgi:hypothetical protein
VQGPEFNAQYHQKKKKKKKRTEGKEKKERKKEKNTEHNPLTQRGIRSDPRTLYPTLTP